ncbi:MAG: aspartate-semialdehyde dehydrogenase, partial [Alphaproteobacteria bacterium]|nr:aspartate-semialdehyde dehydrogenase [Alphaproteobacteria bacterium]
MSYNVAIVGATGAVGREMIKTLAEREFPVDKVFALASKNSVGKEISYGEDEILTVQSVDKFDFANADIALFSAGSELAKQLGPKAGAAGCVVIDNSSA